MVTPCWSHGRACYQRPSPCLSGRAAGLLAPHMGLFFPRHPPPAPPRQQPAGARAGLELGMTDGVHMQAALRTPPFKLVLK